MRPKSKWLRIGSVRVFDEVEPSKAQALKVGEEAAEVYGAWQLTHLPEDKRRLRMIDECCDTIMAACNLLAALGVHDLMEAMGRCVQRNRDRGRITK